MDTLAYPLAAAGADRADVGRGAVLGLLNLVWGLAATTGPLVAGALAESSGDTTAYLLMIATCLAAGTWMLAARRARAPELEQAAT
jgi:MFS family permease